MQMSNREQEWREKLTPEQYHVLREQGTERPFTGALLHEKRKGMFSCAACGAELFASGTKFESGTGWPSFTEPADRENVDLIEDRSHGMIRIEVRCKRCGSHLGHVFPDGPGPTGDRYCVNSVCLAFTPAEE
jgi:peptide-methionine (R)-S-oxide reductase